MATFPESLTPETFERYMRIVQEEQYMQDMTCTINPNNGVITLSKPLPLAYGIGQSETEVFTFVDGKKWVIPQAK